MRVFVTGATGFIGSAIAQELQAAGHRVLGLARNDAAVARLEAMGVEAHRGALADIDRLVAGATACDGVIHMAFIHDFSAYGASVEADLRAVDAMTRALEGTGKPFIGTCVTALLAVGRLGTEADAPTPGTAGHMRAASEAKVLAAAAIGVRSSVVRLPPSVHGAGDRGFVPMLIDVARRTGFAAYIGDGENRWPAVHRSDAARLYRLAVERAKPGSRLHGVAEQGVPMRAIAEAIGRGLGLAVRSLTPDEARAHFGWMAGFVAIDNPSSSELTRQALGWQPSGPGLLEDLRDSEYFSA
jgi:nucleoside-diphosphate-sugar epimerase